MLAGRGGDESEILVAEGKTRDDAEGMCCSVSNKYGHVAQDCQTTVSRKGKGSSAPTHKILVDLNLCRCHR